MSFAVLDFHCCYDGDGSGQQLNTAISLVGLVKTE